MLLVLQTVRCRKQVSVRVRAKPSVYYREDSVSGVRCSIVSHGGSPAIAVFLRLNAATCPDAIYRPTSLKAQTKVKPVNFQMNVNRAIQEGIPSFL